MKTHIKLLLAASVATLFSTVAYAAGGGGGIVTDDGALKGVHFDEKG